jgi:septum site-determining protein MinC
MENIEIDKSVEDQSKRNVEFQSLESSLKDGPLSSVISARGTEDGLILRIDGRSEWELIIQEMKEFLGSRRRFLEGGELKIEWLERLPTKEQSAELEQILKEMYGIEISVKRKKPVHTMLSSIKGIDKKSGDNTLKLNTSTNTLSAQVEMTKIDSPVENKSVDTKSVENKSLSEAFLRDNMSASTYSKKVAELLGENVVYEEDANAKVVFGTMRSGQKVETPFSLIVIGDVNPGADLIAGGDIIVFGSLRGTAHAAAYDDDSQERVIIALQMKPTQLRIGSIISRGTDESSAGAELARIDNRRIMLEPYNPRSLATHYRKRL